MFSALVTIACLLASANVRAASSNFTCADVASGYLVLGTISESSNTERLKPLGPLDQSDTPYISYDSSPPPLFTLESCNSTYMGFPPNMTWQEGYLVVYGRWKLNGKCVTVGGDGALALKTCATADGKALVNQFFDTTFDAPTGSVSDQAETQLIGYTTNDTSLAMYTTVTRHSKTEVVSQTETPPSNDGGSEHRILFYPDTASGDLPF
ncbi:hypothetical protein EXIGLDRAFT_701480 [Exidia glandulosa HHB12029]|uniref:Cyanovirin-N domain-containing protein n=1 Tax=Exidia glandulosa HHB12029 TaxID=1314781 RepID=A0A165CXK4_EXIGL|nr:hypothetical protein EXIGLDRAFT_701480 [Exidia glandulosa HHB12029]